MHMLHVYVMCVHYMRTHIHTLRAYVTCICYVCSLHAYIHTYRCTCIHTHVRVHAHMLTHISQSPYPFIDGWIWNRSK